LIQSPQSFTTSCVHLEPGLLSSAGITPTSSVIRAHPPPHGAGSNPRGSPVDRPLPPVTPQGFPCCHDPPAHTSRRHYPGGIVGCILRSLPQRSQPSPFCGRVGFHISPFGACTAFASAAVCVLARSPKVTLYTEGFGRFVSSTTAPIATGWSESCRVGLTH